MSTDFAPLFEKKFHDKVVPGLLHLMDDNANPRVQAHAGAALGMVSNNNITFSTEVEGHNRNYYHPRSFISSQGLKARGMK